MSLEMEQILFEEKTSDEESKKIKNYRSSIQKISEVQKEEIKNYRPSIQKISEVQKEEVGNYRLSTKNCLILARDWGRPDTLVISGSRKTPSVTITWNNGTSVKKHTFLGLSLAHQENYDGVLGMWAIFRILKIPNYMCKTIDKKKLSDHVDVNFVFALKDVESM